MVEKVDLTLIDSPVKRWPILLVPSFTFPYNIFYYQENGLFCACINRNSTVVCSSKFSGGQCDLNFQLTKVTIKNTALDFRLEYLNYFIQFKQSYLTINQSDFFFLSRVCVDIETSDSDECLFKPVFASEK